MICGIGTDLASIGRMRGILARHGERLVERVLAPAERAEFAGKPDPAAFLAKRFAAKEALGKALGTGIRAPVTFHNAVVAHDALGRPQFAYAPELSDYLASRKLVVHLSLSDDGDFALAFAVAEQRTKP